MMEEVLEEDLQQTILTNQLFDYIVTFQMSNEFWLDTTTFWLYWMVIEDISILTSLKEFRKIKM